MFPKVQLSRAKTETRRLGFWNETLDVPRLNIGEVCWSVEKTQGLKRGEKVQRVWPIVITGVFREPLENITQEAVIREGFPHLTTPQFVKMFQEIHKGKGITPETLVTVIQFDYVVYRGKFNQVLIPQKYHAQSFKQVYKAIKETNGSKDLRREFALNYRIARNCGISDIEFCKFMDAKKGVKSDS